jgi:septal ring factor EnvC (AmiA/AmiB activator)
MACGLMKKGLLGATLGAGALYLAFGTSAPSYVRTAFHKVRDGAKSAVGIQFQIDRAREEIASLEPARHNNIENLARAIEDVKDLDTEIVAIRGNLGTEEKILTSLRDKLTTGDFKLAGNITYTADEVKTDLKLRLDSYKRTKELLKEKEETLKAKQKAVAAGERQLAQIEMTKRALETKLASIEARLKMIQATQDTNEFNFDDSALARAKSSIADLEKQLNVMARTAELEGKFSGSNIPVLIDNNRDVLKEMDAEFGPPAVKTSSGDKNL